MAAIARVEARMMKAVYNAEYGSPDQLKFEEIARPEIGDDGVLVRVRAASVNPFDWHLMRGSPYLVRLMVGLRRPKRGVPGVDAAGTVEAVGDNVTAFQPGDEVFGSCGGTFAEYALGEESDFVPKPANLTFEQASALPGAGVTALQALRAGGGIQAGQRVLINGGSGGVGTFAVQIAKGFGAHATGVCSTRNIALVRSVGADDVIDYTVEDFTRNAQRYDLIIDTVGNRSLLALRRVLTPNGTLVVIGGKGGRLLGGLSRKLRALLLNRFVTQRLVPLMAKVTKEDMVVLKELTEAGTLAPVIDRTYALSEAADAIRYVETGHTRGKVVISVI